MSLYGRGKLEKFRATERAKTAPKGEYCAKKGEWGRTILKIEQFFL
jgi:hypothetical protein